MSNTRPGRWVKFVLAGVLVLAVAATAVWAYLTQPHLSTVERGRRLAEEYGCFGCHGAEGAHGVFNPGRLDATVPNWHGDLMMYARNPTQIREWIRDGVTAARAESQTWQEQREKGALKMPAFGSRLSEGEIDDLVAYIQMVSGDLVPDDSLARAGYFRADSLGCYGCHGGGGWLSRPNPGSLKGYVASWATEDFHDLVQDRQEFDEWINAGVSSRFKDNPLASYFLERSALQMPAYRSHVRPGDLDALWAYTRWLQTQEYASRQGK